MKLIDKIDKYLDEETSYTWKMKKIAPIDKNEIMRVINIYKNPRKNKKKTIEVAKKAEDLFKKDKIMELKRYLNNIVDTNFEQPTGEFVEAAMYIADTLYGKK